MTTMLRVVSLQQLCLKALVECVEWRCFCWCQGSTGVCVTGAPRGVTGLNWPATPGATTTCTSPTNTRPSSTGSHSPSPARRGTHYTLIYFCGISFRVAKFACPHVLGDQKICEDNQKLRPGCPPDYQIFFERIDLKIVIPTNLSSYLSFTNKNSSMRTSTTYI